MMKSKLLTVSTSLVIGVLAFATPSLASSSVNASVDINKLINQSGSLLGSLGITPSGTVKETGDYWCTFNNWSDRDKYARSHGSFDNGRWSHGAAVGGRWYCAAKHG